MSKPAEADRVPDDRRAFQTRLRGTNIHEETFLATDYLNHFNEIVMLLDMIPDMPECLEDARAWRPKTYEEHFRDSSFSDKELAIEAYRRAPERFRKPFDETVATMNRLVGKSLERIEAAVASQDRAATERATSAASRGLQKLIDMAGAIIHGGESTMQQDEIDRLLDV